MLPKSSVAICMAYACKYYSATHVEKTINFQGPKWGKLQLHRFPHSNFTISRWKKPGNQGFAGFPGLGHHILTPGRTRRAEAPRGCWDVEFRYPGLLEGGVGSYHVKFMG